MAAYQQITDSGEGNFSIVYQQVDSSSPWGVYSTTYPTEAAADAQAIALVEAGTYQARVCKPTGVLFRKAA